jgi:hypothetical protein
MTAMAVMMVVVMMMVVDLLLLRLLCLFAAFIDDPNVVVENRRDDRYHVGLDDSCADVLCATNTNVDDALEGEVPFPHAHHVFAATLLKDADQPLDAAIDSQDVSNSG